MLGDASVNTIFYFNMNTEEETGTEIEENFNHDNTPEVEGMGEGGKASIPWKKIFSFIGNALWWITKFIFRVSWWIVKTLFCVLRAILPGLLKGMQQMGRAWDR